MHPFSLAAVYLYSKEAPTTAEKPVPPGPAEDRLMRQRSTGEPAATAPRHHLARLLLLNLQGRGRTRAAGTEAAVRRRFNMVRRVIAGMILMSILLPTALVGQEAQESRQTASPHEVARQARRDAAGDAKDFTPSWWGTGAFAASLVLSPLIGGGAVTVIGYTAKGQVEVPAVRMIEAEERYGDYRLLDVYEEEYEDAYGDIKTRKQGGRALLGTGLAFGFYVALYTALLAGY